ncbi:hypothetical protein HMPREF0239_01557 [Clostridium sp. ATCC BAA-442]|nr:hypothetical protein HMPREF0239_01557 [Clostridium sp. ATCC BAA-442]
MTLWFLPHHILLSEFLDQRAAPYPPSSLHNHSVSHFIHHIKEKRKLNLLFFTYYTPRYRDVSLSIAEEILIKRLWRGSCLSTAQYPRLRCAP